jgi:hypothetical protein
MTILITAVIAALIAALGARLWTVRAEVEALRADRGNQALASVRAHPQRFYTPERIDSLL